jgi:hypothetical protein
MIANYVIFLRSMILIINYLENNLKIFIFFCNLFKKPTLKTITNNIF